MKEVQLSRKDTRRLIRWTAASVIQSVRKQLPLGRAINLRKSVEWGNTFGQTHPYAMRTALYCPRVKMARFIRGPSKPKAQAR